MACTVQLRTDLLSGEDTGGTWVYDGFHATDPNGTPGAGGSSQPPLTGDNPAVDTSGFTTGFYFYTYSGGSSTCTDSQQTKIEVMKSPYAGTDGSDSGCTNEARVVDMDNLISGEDTGGTWTETSATSSDSGAFNAATGEFDYSNQGSAGTFTFEYTVDSPTPTSGFTDLNCPDCNADVSEVTITVTDQFEAGTATPAAVCN